jgi:P27 family predicted phage terminase small subunit
MLVQAEQDIQENGIICISEKGGKYQNPAVGVANTSKKMIATFCGRFGLTPADRAKIDIPEKKDDEENTMLSLVGGGKNA